MVCKKYFKIRVMSVMNSGINRMILCTSIGGILHTMEFYVGEVTDYFDFLYLSVLLHNL